MVGCILGRLIQKKLKPAEKNYPVHEMENVQMELDLLGDDSNSAGHEGGPSTFGDAVLDKEAELEELLLETCDEKMPDVDTSANSNVILMIFEFALSDAKMAQEAIFAQKSKWLMCAKAPVTSGTTITESSDEETTPITRITMTIILPGQESPEPEPTEVDSDDLPAPTPALPDFKKRTPSTASLSPTLSLSVRAFDKTEGELLAEAKIQLDELHLNRRQADRLKMQMTLHLNNASPTEREARMMDLQNMTHQRNELEAKYEATRAAYKDLLRHSIVPVLQSASSRGSTASTPYERTDRDVHIKILSNRPTFNGKDAMSAYTFFD